MDRGVRGVEGRRVIPAVGWSANGTRFTFEEAREIARKEGHFYRFVESVLVALERQTERVDGWWLSPSGATGCARRRVLQAAVDYWVKPEKVWSRFLGSAVHRLFNQGREFDEMRLMAYVDVPIRLDGETRFVSFPVLGTLDSYDAEHRRLYDFKTTFREFMVYDKASGKRKARQLPDPEYEVQTNIYRWLLEQNGYPVDEILIQYLRNAPNAPRQVVPVPIWSEEDVLLTIVEAATPLVLTRETGELPPCTCRYEPDTDPDLCHEVTEWDLSRVKEIRV